MRRHAVNGGAHGVFAHAESQVSPGVAPLAADRAHGVGASPRRLEIALSFERGFGGRVEIGRAADQFGDALRQRVHSQAAGHACGDGFIARLPFWQIRPPSPLAVCRRPSLKFGGLGRELLRYAAKRFLPVGLRVRAPVHRLAEIRHGLRGGKTCPWWASPAPSWWRAIRLRRAASRATVKLSCFLGLP